MNIILKFSVIADRGITGSASIYQSVYIYDLRTRRFERKVPGVYIIPSQAHEFKLLNDELLMGLSENRNQIYIWNLKTGRQSYCTLEINLGGLIAYDFYYHELYKTQSI